MTSAESVARDETPATSLPSWAITLITVVIIVADRLSKAWATGNLAYGIPRRVIGDYLRFTLNWNQGAAMGTSLGSFSRIGFSLAAVAVLAMLAVFYRRSPVRPLGMQIALGLIAGGAIGNLIDRLTSVRGVVDFIDAGIGNARFWTFNVADSAVTCGAVLLAITLSRVPKTSATSLAETDAHT
jgi:signal peptidase II